MFLPGILEGSLARINKGLPAAAIDEAVLKIQNVEGGTLEQRNETFTDYLQSGVEVRFSDGDYSKTRAATWQTMLDGKMDASGKVSVGAARTVRKALPNASYIGFTGTHIFRS